MPDAEEGADGDAAVPLLGELTCRKCACAAGGEVRE